MRGLLLAGGVTGANVQDRDDAMSLLPSLRHQFSRSRCIGADQASTGDLVVGLWGLRLWRNVCLAMVQDPERTKGCLLLPKRWIVERPFGWLGRYCRVSKRVQR